MLKILNVKQISKGFDFKIDSKAFNVNNIVGVNKIRFLKKFSKPSPDGQSSQPENIKENSADYIKVFPDTTPIESFSNAFEQGELVIRAAYKQVFGNAHIMESERNLEAESQLLSGRITVMEFIRQLAKSERYQSLVFDDNSNLRAIELNFKHLLGRTPESHKEVSEHIAILTNEGFEAEIDSYLNSDEYFKAFGTDIVPYYRGYQTQSGRHLSGYAHSFKIARGASSSDKSTPTLSYIKLDVSLLKSNPVTAFLNNVNISEKIKKFTDIPLAPKPAVSKYGPRSMSPSASIYTIEAISRRAVKRK